jgi:gliding motility-associated-like protein
MQVQTIAPFSCANIGANTVVLTVADSSGNTHSANATVTVLDNISPTAVAQNITIYLDANGNANIVGTDVNNGSTDNCAIASYSVSPNTFTCADSNANPVTLTVTDVSGNSATATATVTVLDNIAPTVVTQNITVYLDANGNASIVPADVNNSSTDNCAIANYDVSPNSFSCANIGSNTVTLTVTDVSGNTATATATVTVLDNIAPTVVTQNITVYLDANGNASIVPADVNNGSTDNCAIASYSVSPNTFTCADSNANSVTLTVTDVSGNVNTAAAAVTVLDTIAPTVITQNITVNLDANGNASIVAADVNNGSTDNCAIASMSVSPNTFTCADSNANTVTLTVTDVSGNVNTATATVTVIDNIAPTVSTQNITIYLSGFGTATLLPSQVDNGSSDNCAIATYNVSPNSFACADTGSNTVTLTITDVSGNTNTATANVIVLDTLVPNVVAQNATVYLDANGQVSITPATVDGGSSNSCGAGVFSVTPNTFTCADSGDHVVTLTLTSTSGVSNSATGTVTVIDNLAPTVLTQNITVYLDANGDASILAADVNNGSTDNCAIASYSVSPNTFTCADSNANTVTLTVTDISGNVNTATATVTVLDTFSPVVVTQNITVYLDANGNASIVPADVNNGSTDNCAIASYSVSPNTFTCADSNANTVTLTVTDVSGNVNTATATVTVLDTISPTAIAQNITVYLDANGNASIVGSDVNNGSTDNCAIASYSVSPNTFTCADSNANTVTLSVTDVSGNTATATATVTVLDNIAPTVVTQNITVYLDANGNASIVPADVNNSSTDNCAIATYDVSPNSFSCANIGSNTVTLTVTDVSGNTNTATATVTVLDNIAPTVVTQNITVYLDANGNASIVPADVNNGSTDNCAIASYSVSPNTFTCADSNANTVILTVTDVSGNTASATATVTVLDTIAPTVITQNITVNLDANGNASIVAADVNNGSTDNCAIASMSVSPNTFTCADSNANTVTLTVTDISGNVNTATATVTIVDNIAPIVSTQNITVYLTGLGTASIVPSQVDNSSTDNCAIATYDVSPNSFSCADTGSNTVTLTITDVSGNVNSATANVIVLDTLVPTVITQNATVYLDANGQVSITTATVDGGSSNSCSVGSFTVIPNNFTCADSGNNVVTLTMTSGSGVSNSATAIVTVLDTIAPTVNTQNITVYLDANGAASIVAADVNNGSTDNCAIASYSVSPNTFICADSNANTVTLTVTDVSGNVNTATATVTVLDTFAPSAVTQDITVYLDANGAASIVPADVDNNSTDNCAIASYDVQPNSFNCNDTATNVVTLTLVDVSGNTSSATAIVTVLDTIAPTVIGQNIISYLDVNGTSSITVNDVNNGSFDNCGIDTLYAYPTAFSQVDTGDNVITIVVTDQNGNIDSNTVIVTVVDTIAPTAIAQNITIYLDANGSAVITANQLDNGSFDNCGVDTITLSQYVFSCADSNANTIAFTVTDINGNATTVNTTVTVFDTIAPSVVTQNITVYLDANGGASIVPADVDNNSTDNCAIASYDVQPNTFNCNDTAANVVTLALIDVSGNTSSATAIVTVLDTIAPTIIGQNVTIYADTNGNSSITASQINNGTFDNCSVDTVFASPLTFNASNVGNNTVTLYAIDVNGNIDSSTVIVTILDTVAPIVITQNISIFLDSNGLIGIDTADINNGSSDNCGIDSMYLSQTDFDCSHVGINTVILYVIDVNGNIDSAEAQVTISDTISPVLLVNNLTVYLDQNGEAFISVIDANSGSFDNCAIDTMFVSQTDFNCENVGANSVLFTAIDIYANSDSVLFEVTVLDTIRPTVITQNITLYLDESGAATTTASAINASSFDNCGIQSIFLSDSSFAYADGNSVSIWLIVTDVNGNIDSTQATITLVDTIAPSIACPVSFSTCDINIDYELPEVADNTEVSSLVLTAGLNPGDAFEVGITTITYVVTDLSGNQNTCSFDIERYVLPTVTAMADTSVYYSENIDMIITDSLAVSYLWTPSEFLSDASAKNPVCSPTESTLYTIEVTSENGCKASDEVNVTVLYEIKFAQAFSPNGDGENDFFEILGIEFYPNCNVTIVNRYGLKLFSSDGYNQPWDGTYKGELLPMGSYFYVIKLSDSQKALTGSITIIR